MRVTLLLYGVIAVSLCVCTGRRPEAVSNGIQAPCPATPNCVSSKAADKTHAIEPFVVRGDAAAAMQRLTDIIRQYPRTRIIKATDSYLYAEFRTRLFRFTDDVEFFADSAAGVIHVRSASRLGASDLGVNRRRIEELRRLFTSSSPD